MMQRMAESRTLLRVDAESFVPSIREQVLGGVCVFCSSH